MYEDEEDESQMLSMSDYSSIDIRNERFNNSMFNNNNNKNDTNLLVKGHHRIFRKVNNKTVPIYIYTTRYTPGSKIHNAVSGFSDKHIVVGKASDEDQFFKVSLSTGELGKDPYGTHLYYDSPEQYEKHFYTTIQDKRIKDAWWKKYRLNQKMINKEFEDTNRPEFTVIH